MAQPSAESQALRLRLLALLYILVSLASLGLGVLIAPWAGPAWPWLIALVGLPFTVFAFLGWRDQELRRLAERESEERVNRAREHLRLTMRAARIGTLDWDVVADRLTWSDNVPDILGVALPAGGLSIAGFHELIEP